MLLPITFPGDIFQQPLRWPTQTWGIQVFLIPAHPLLSAPRSGPAFTPTTTKAAKSPAPHLSSWETPPSPTQTRSGSGPWAPWQSSQEEHSSWWRPCLERPIPPLQNASWWARWESRAVPWRVLQGKAWGRGGHSLPGWMPDTLLLLGGPTGSQDVPWDGALGLLQPKMGLDPSFRVLPLEGRSTLSLPVCVSLPGSELRQHQPCTAFGSEPGPQCLASPLGDVPCSVTQRQGWGRGGQVRLIESCLMGGEIQTPFWLERPRWR